MEPCQWRLEQYRDSQVDQDRVSDKHHLTDIAINVINMATKLRTVGHVVKIGHLEVKLGHSIDRVMVTEITKGQTVMVKETIQYP